MLSEVSTKCKRPNIGRHRVKIVGHGREFKNQGPKNVELPLVKFNGYLPKSLPKLQRKDLFMLRKHSTLAKTVKVS